MKLLKSIPLNSSVTGAIESIISQLHVQQKKTVIVCVLIAAFVDVDIK